MIAAAGLRWLLTLVFAAVAGYAGWRAAVPVRAGGRRQDTTERVAHALHAVMAVAMAVMAWPWGMRLPAMPQIVFFALAGGWFPAVALVRARRTGLGRGLLHALPHAVMMGAMAWMLAVMTAGDVPHSGGGAGSMADMPGMDMSAPGATATMTLHGTDGTVAAVLAAAFLALALRRLARGFDLARAAPRRERAAGEDTADRARGAEDCAVGQARTAADTADRDRRAGEDTADRARGAGDRVLSGAYDLSCHGVMALGMAVMLAVLA
ncbi:DUF5134 domain-containing protein [Streptomyces tremellae]|uniref:DUF5134 domain-containing protein n=1 Tax=Streptomyces tremellae TaxID=1124239 RepID=A0ABP7FCY6_9ACTN